METTFTKGVWKLTNKVQYGRVGIDLGDAKESIDIWYHEGVEMTKEEAIANAKLIVSAPEMLQTLYWIQSAIKDGSVKGLFKDEIDKINSTINKAIGV